MIITHAIEREYFCVLFFLVPSAKPLGSHVGPEVSSRNIVSWREGIVAQVCRPYPWPL